jgi:uncharacterized SAM-binding protein YcdF (DUF218 family)
MTDEVIDTQSLVGEPGPEAHDRSQGRSWKRWLLIACAGFVGLCLLYYAVTLIQVVRAGRQTDPNPAEAIVVLGAAQYDGRPSPQLASRLDHALELYDEGVAPVVLVTGGNQPGDRFTEAEASANYLLDRGVPESAIMREDVGHTTFESLAAAADQLLAADLDDVVVVTDPYHSLRSKLIAEEVGLDASVSPTPTSVVTGWSSFRRELEEAAGVAVGRIIGFDRLTDLTG